MIFGICWNIFRYLRMFGEILELEIKLWTRKVTFQTLTLLYPNLSYSTLPYITVLYRTLGQYWGYTRVGPYPSFNPIRFRCFRVYWFHAGLVKRIPLRIGFSPVWCASIVRRFGFA